MTGRRNITKTTNKFAPRVAIRFNSEEDYAAVHHAAARAKLSMNAWMIKILLEAAGKTKKPWKRQENRNVSAA